MSFHDEPLVVDNGPLGIDVGQHHDEGDKVKPDGATWVREISQFNKIVVICKKGAGVNGEIETRIASLAREDGKPLTLTLAGGSSGTSRTLTFSWVGDGSDKLRITPIGFVLSKNGRRLTQGNGLRISSLSWYESETQTTPTQFPPGGTQSNHDSIFIGLYP
jgi:hypothetical protein